MAAGVQALLSILTTRKLTNEAAIDEGLEQKAKEFVEKGAEVHAKT